MRRARDVLVILVVVVLASPAVSFAAGGPLAVAPGRIVLALEGQDVHGSEAVPRVTSTVVTPDGGTLLFGFQADGTAPLNVTRIDRHGALDGSFGTGGRASVQIARQTLASLRRILLQPDGKLLLISDTPDATTPLAGTFRPARLTVTRLNADLSLDAAYGTGGTTVTGIMDGSGSNRPAILQPDGALVLSGSTSTRPLLPARLDFDWSLTRLTPDGAIDRSFGAAGIVTIATGLSTSGFDAAPAADGTIVVGGQTTGGAAGVLLARLTRGGALDPAFGGGTPVGVPLRYALPMLLRGDGSVLLQGPPTEAKPTSRQVLARYTPSGALDPGFGTGGIAELGADIAPNQLLPGPGGSLVVAGALATPRADGTFPQGDKLEIRRLTSEGRILERRRVTPPFGGGASSSPPGTRPRTMPSLLQNSFAGALLARADGSFLVPGSVGVGRRVARREYRSLERFAATSLTPSLAVDRAFGGAAEKPHAAVRLMRQRAVSARRLGVVRVELRSSAIGLARVTVSRRGRAIARGLLVTLDTKRHVMPVELTTYGMRYLRGHRDVKVAVEVVVRDLLGTTRRAAASGRLTR